MVILEFQWNILHKYEWGRKREREKERKNRELRAKEASGGMDTESWFTEKMKFIDNQWRIISKDNGHSFTDFKDILHDYVTMQV